MTFEKKNELHEAHLKKQNFGMKKNFEKQPI